MGKKTLIVSLAMVALSGCGIPTFSNKDTTKENTPKPAVKVRDKVVSTKPNPRSSQPEPNFVPDLIATTNAQERRETVVKGRNDPFTIIPIEPIVTIESTASPSPPEVRLPPPPKVTPTPQSEVTPTSPPQDRKPPPPQPMLAREVAVTGLIQVGEVTKIIVKSPQEKYSRYVEQGQYLANGKVLVKRIETGGGGKPIVVLEELGIEVIKRVGDSTFSAVTRTPRAVASQ